MGPPEPLILRRPSRTPRIISVTIMVVIYLYLGVYISGARFRRENEAVSRGIGATNARSTHRGTPLSNRGRRASPGLRREMRPVCRADREKLGPLKNSSQSFESVGVSPYLVHRLNDMSIYHPTRIQAASIPYGLRAENQTKFHDLILEEKTGQGKTLAYLVPIVSEIDNFDASLQAIVSVPSTTLARQVMRVLLELTKGGKRKRKDYPITSTLIVDQPDQSFLAEFEEEVPHILVGIPSFLEYVLENSFGVELSELRHLVLDEVDKMISIEREKLALERLMKMSKTEADAQILFVSASMTKDSMRLADSYMGSIKRVSTLGVADQAEKFLNSSGLSKSPNEESKLPDRIRNYFIPLEKPTLRSKGNEIARLYRALSEAKFDNKRRRGSRPGLLVFVRNPASVGPLIDQLRGQHRLEVRGIDQRTNKKQLKQARELMASGRLQVLVGTELVARGMDIEGVTDVVNIDVPRSSNAYLHRAGRAGRLKGKLASSSSVFTFVTNDQMGDIDKISRNLNVKFTKARITKTQRLVKGDVDGTT
ncbi:hypothetical protein AAMO2058_000375100 [Amorphochlora amoebiformis]